MTDPNHQNCNSHLWLAEYLDISNGFVTEFTMDVGQHTCANVYSKSVRICTLNFFDFTCKVKYDYTFSKCGAEGFAFVLQNSNQNATGLSGSGLGYEKIKDTLAVEFDFATSTAKNDPVTDKEYHISVIVKPGLASASESDSIVNNYNPTNFKMPSTNGVIFH